MRANHATEPQEPAPRGVTGAAAGTRHTIGRRLPRPRAVAAGGALLAQLWGFGAPAAHAVNADPAADRPHPAVRRAPHDGTAPGGDARNGDARSGDARNGAGPDPAVHDGTVRDGQSAGRSAGQAPAAGNGAANSPGPVGSPTGGSPAGGAAGQTGDGLRERIRAGGLPLPGERAALPDAFAIASGLLGGIPAQPRPAEPRAARDGEPAGLPTVPQQRAAARPAEAQLPPGATAARPARDTTATDGSGAPAAPVGGADLARSATTPTGTPFGAATPEELALADTATVTAVDGSATATAVLAPIAAGLLLTGAAMCKHRGLPRGH
ncbi:hypothetical protein ACPC54_39040 [Kitasatospora sp. NPDC094028]